MTEGECRAVIKKQYGGDPPRKKPASTTQVVVSDETESQPTTNMFEEYEVGPPYPGLNPEGQYYDEYEGDGRCSRVEETLIHAWNIGVGPTLTLNGVANESIEVAHETGLPGPWNGPQDSFRHCYLNCRMTQEFGADDALIVGNVHEACGGNELYEIEADLYNNQVGIGLAGGDCEAGCLQALENGLLVVLPPDTWR
jgi:hypothetical protein